MSEKRRPSKFLDMVRDLDMLPGHIYLGYESIQTLLYTSLASRLPPQQKTEYEKTIELVNEKLKKRFKR